MLRERLVARAGLVACDAVVVEASDIADAGCALSGGFGLGK